jgi:phage/plasmid-like protein (TIGR03299 family)
MSGEVETMAYAGEVPWHGLGNNVSNDLSPRQIMVESGTDWMVEKIGATVKIGGIDKDINRAALVRSSDNKILDTVTREWCPLQNEDAFQFFHDFVMAGDMEMHTAGSLKGGQIVWCLAKIKDGFIVAGKDHVESHLLFTNPHQFGKAIDIRFTPIRVVCWNTLCLAMGTGSTFDQQQVVRLSHRKAFEPEKAKELLGIAHSKLVTYKEAAEFMAGVRFNDDALNRYFREIFPKKTSKKEEASISRNHSIALDVIRSQPGADMAEGTWWQAFNAVTYMTDHLMGRAVDSRLQSAWFGSNRDLKTKALTLATAFAGNA